MNRRNAAYWWLIVFKLYCCRRLFQTGTAGWLAVWITCLSVASTAAENPGDSVLQLSRNWVQEQQYQKVIALLPAHMPDSLSLTPFYAEALQLLVQSYTALGNKEKSYRFQLRYNQVHDSLLSLKKVRESAQTNAVFQLEEMTNAILKQQIDLNRRKNELYRSNAFLGIALTVSFFAFLFFYLSRKGYLQKQQTQAQVWAQLEREAESKRLQSVIHAELLEREKVFQSLQNNLLPQLKHLEERVAHLSAYEANAEARSGFHEALTEIQSTQKEVEVIFSAVAETSQPDKNLVDLILEFLEAISDKHKILFSYNTDTLFLPDLVVHHLMRIIQEWVQNSLKHGGAPHSRLELSFYPESLTISLKNARMGGRLRSDERIGLGLENMVQRVNALQGNMEWSSEDDFLIHIIIPLGAKD